MGAAVGGKVMAGAVGGTGGVAMAIFCSTGVVSFVETALLSADTAPVAISAGSAAGVGNISAIAGGGAGFFASAAGVASISIVFATVARDGSAGRDFSSSVGAKADSLPRVLAAVRVGWRR